VGDKVVLISAHPRFQYQRGRRRGGNYNQVLAALGVVDADKVPECVYARGCGARAEVWLRFIGGLSVNKSRLSGKHFKDKAEANEWGRILASNMKLPFYKREPRREEVDRG